MSRKIINVDIIKERADENYFNIVTDHYGLNMMKKRGSQYCVTCPSCGKVDKLQFSKAKLIFKCFSCDFSGKGAIDFYKKVLNLEFVDAIKKASEYLNIELEFESNKLKPKKPIDTAPVEKPVKKHKSFLQEQLEQSGLTIEDVTGEFKMEDGTIKTMSRYVSGKIQGDTIVEGNDLVLIYQNLQGKHDTYLKKRANGDVYGKPINYYRTRNQRPEDHLNKDGKPMKYTSPYGSGLHIWHSVPLLKKYKAKQSITTLYINEGEKKADKVSKHGIISCGIAGINNLINAKGLHSDFGDIINTCKTKNIVFTVDSDWNTKISDDVKESIDYRARGFLAAVRKFQTYFNSFTNQGIDLKLFFSYVLPNENKDKGTDDLLVNTLAGKEDELLKDYEYAMKQGDGMGKYIACIDITSYSETKLKELFCLQSKEAFANHYKSQLKDRESFFYSGTKFRFTDNGEVELAQPLAPNQIFWEIERTSKGAISYKFIANHFQNFLKDRLNIGRIIVQQEPLVYKMVKLDKESRTIDFVENFQIEDYIFNFLLAIDEIKVYNWLFVSDNLFNEKKLNRAFFIDDLCPLIKNEKSTGYMFFKSSFWKITPDGVHGQLLNDVPGSIWKSQVIDFAPKLHEEPLFTINTDDSSGYKIKFSENWQSCHFFKFLFNSSLFCKRGITPTESDLEECYKHLITKITAFGYMMHRYFDPATTKAIVAIDGKESDLGASNGRSGKSLFFEGLSNLVVQVKIDGKKPELEKDKYLWAQVNEKTANVYIDDITRVFNFEMLFFLITGGSFSVREIFKAERKIPKELTPKIGISSNHGIPGYLNNSSYQDRIHPITFSDYYDAEHKPVDDFDGIRFFDDWDFDQWNNFYNFAALAYSAFLKYGLISFQDNRQRNVFLIAFLGSRFKDWADTYIKNNNKFGEKMLRFDMYADFKKMFPQDKLEPRGFRLKLIAYATLFNCVVNPHKPPLKKVDQLGYIGNFDKPDGKEYYTLAPIVQQDNFANDIDSIESTDVQQDNFANDIDSIESTEVEDTPF